MQRKLKSVFRRSSKSERSNGTHHIEAKSPRSDVSAGHDGRTSVDSSLTGSVYTGRSRPVSSSHDGHRQISSPTNHVATKVLPSSADSNGGAIANDYKAYLPALSPVKDDHAEEYISLGGDRRHIVGESETRNEEDVADRNIARYGTSVDEGSKGSTGVTHGYPVGVASSSPTSNSAPGQEHTRQRSIGSTSGDSFGSVGKYAVDNGVITNGGLVDGIRPHIETSLHEKNSWKRTSFPPKAARPVESGGGKRKPNVPDSDNDAPQPPHDTNTVRDVGSGVRNATMDGTADGEETTLARKLREDGVVDLRNTIDTDGEIKWAPAITHEVIKPHQHEIIQHKIYREIHNYEHFHRIQPVMMTEVLPPRHWIPNPNGEGLIEISADELPSRTGENRWWSICEHPSPYAKSKTGPKYRTEPEIIEAGTFITEEGFERKETIIIHPPTLADLTGYAGPVQAVHFDHKTGKRWMGELTTMDKLHELQETLNRAPDARSFDMNGLSESLPRSPSTSMPSRKPVSGHPSSKAHGSNVGRKLSAARASVPSS